MHGQALRCPSVGHHSFRRPAPQHKAPVTARWRSAWAACASYGEGGGERPKEQPAAAAEAAIEREREVHRGLEQQETEVLLSLAQDPADRAPGQMEAGSEEKADLGPAGTTEETREAPDAEEKAPGGLRDT